MTVILMGLIAHYRQLYISSAQENTPLHVLVSPDGVNYSESITINKGEGYYLKTNPPIDGYLEARSPYPNDPRYPSGYRTFKWARSPFNPTDGTNDVYGTQGIFKVPSSMLTNFPPGTYEGWFRPWVEGGSNAPWSNKATVVIKNTQGTASGSGEVATGRSYVLIGAGDIGSKDGDNDAQTAKLLGNIVGENPDALIFTAGDNVNETPVYYEDFKKYFEPTWGKFKEKIRPAPGNHDYTDKDTGGTASGYFQYYGAAAGEKDKGYYSYNIGENWHVISLNSMCSKIGGCGANSPQGIWLKNDLERNKNKACTIAYWHYPYYTTGSHDPIRGEMSYVWETLNTYGADIVVSGHNHDYERYSKQDGSGNKNEKGIRQFVVGTGGKSLRGFSKPQEANQEVRDASSFGVIKFTLSPDRYAWQFIPTEGNSFTDSGETICNGANRAITSVSTNTTSPNNGLSGQSNSSNAQEGVKRVKNIVVPIDGDTQTSVNANLEWYSEPSANRYTVYFEESINPPTKILVSNTDKRGYDLPKLKENTTYFWKVDTTSPSGTVQGQVRKFTTEGKDTPPDFNAMVVVPDGEYMRGCDKNRDSKNNPCNYNDEWHIDTPLRSLWIDAFKLDKYEVTNQEYKECVSAGKCKLPGNTKHYNDMASQNDPVVYVSNYDAQNYCAWEGKRLPTEAEWEKAARGAVDTRLYPWGNEKPTCDLANGSSLGCKPKKPHPIGGRYLGASPYGARDMAGNVFEWVHDKYTSRYYENAPAINPQGPKNSRYSVNQTFDDPNPIFIVRSGAWNLTLTHYLRVNHRHYGHHGLNGPFTDAPLYRSEVVGFRCAKSL